MFSTLELSQQDPMQPSTDNGNLSRSLGPMAGFTSVFRVSRPHRTQVQAEEVLQDATTQQQALEPAYHARRTHRKSRNGCLNCKRRRVKCDETKPQCQKCQRYGVTCDYFGVQFQPVNKDKGIAIKLLAALNRHSPPDAMAYSMCLASAAEKIDELLQPDSPTTGGCGSNLRVTNKSLQAIHHFTNFTIGSIISESAQALMQREVMQLAFEKPYLLQSIMATATTHLSRIVPDNRAYKVAEAYHWHRAISLYSQEIRAGVGPHNMDALYTTSMLTGVISFSAEEYNPTNSWIFTDDPAGLNWLLLQSGLRHLLEMTNCWFSRSIWFEVFQESHDESNKFHDDRPGRVGLHPEFADLCEIDETTTVENNPYHWPLRMLSNILDLERSPKSFLKYVPFMGRLLPGYTDLLQEKDPRAVLILSWWLALMCVVENWWMAPRVHSECVAICMFLENSTDPRILHLLEFPAEACGYTPTLPGKRDLLDDLRDCGGLT